MADTGTTSREEGSLTEVSDEQSVHRSLVHRPGLAETEMPGEAAVQSGKERIGGMFQAQLSDAAITLHKYSDRRELPLYRTRRQSQ
jgi:hypothetical protein